ncbi:hypothetical protein AgCh_008583 [Apium graveolens]
MEHLPVHLPEECRLGGPVPSRWVYNIERLQRRMKQKVGNKARVEGSIAEKYVHEELTHFCSMYFESGVETSHNLLGRNVVDDRSRDPHKLEAFTYPVELLGAYTGDHLDVDSLHVAVRYILTNMREVAFYITMFEEDVRSRNTYILSDTEMDTMLKAHFGTWLQNKVQHNYEKFQYLLQGPAFYVLSYKRCKVNGYSFNLGKSSSGILVKGSCYGDTGIDYYGTLQEERYINICEKKGVDPKETQIQSWIEAVGGVRKNTILEHPRVRASDVYEFEGRPPPPRKGEGSSGRSALARIQDEMFMRIVDQTLAQARANPEEYSLTPEKIRKTIATENDSDGGGSDSESTESEDDRDMSASAYDRVPRGGPVIRG